MDNNVNVLDELNKGATMGMDAIKYVYDKVGDSVFKKVLDGEYRKYKEIADRIAIEYDKFSIKEPHSTNVMTKAMSWYGIQMKTMTEGVRLQNQNKDEDLTTNVRQILDDFVVMQEDSVETLKKYL